jgi:hypothetical protein
MKSRFAPYFTTNYNVYKTFFNEVTEAKLPLFFSKTKQDPKHQYFDIYPMN